MLLPESNRSGLPFVVSLTIQCSLVALLAIPWTVQTLRNSMTMQLPVVLNLAPPRPIETQHTRDTPSAVLHPLTIPRSQVQLFRPPMASSTNASTSVFPTAPDIAFTPGTPNGFGAAGQMSDVLAHSNVGTAAPPSVPAKAEMHDQTILVGGDVQAAKLIRRVQPVYPALARQVRVQGVVTLDAIIGTDGSIQMLRVLNGHPMLVRSALEAVQQWKYSPTILNGKAVEVKTTIEVRFTLSQQN